MKTRSGTTIILLEGGSEDVALLAELHKVTAWPHFRSIEEYPLLHELKQGLEREKESEL